MKCSQLLILTLTLITVNLFAQADSNVKLEDFFPCIEGKTWQYNYLKPLNNGQTRMSFVECTFVGNEEGELKAILKTISFLGTMKIERNDVYAIAENMLMLEKTIGMMGTKEYFERPVQLRIPINNSISWTNKSKDVSQGKTYNTTHIFVSKFIDADTLLVTKSEYDSVEGIVTFEKNYYKRNIGLTRCEVFLRDDKTKIIGKEPSMTSYQLAE